MRLLTHNMLACNIKGVTKGFPLLIEATKLETKESEMNPEFLRHIYPKLDWKALHEAAHSVRTAPPHLAFAAYHTTLGFFTLVYLYFDFCFRVRNKSIELCTNLEEG